MRSPRKEGDHQQVDTIIEIMPENIIVGVGGRHNGSRQPRCSDEYGDGGQAFYFTSQGSGRKEGVQERRVTTSKSA